MNHAREEAAPPRPGLLTQSEVKISEDDKDLLNRNIPLENLEKLSKHLGISPGDMSQVLFTVRDGWGS